MYTIRCTAHEAYWTLSNDRNTVQILEHIFGYIYKNFKSPLLFGLKMEEYKHLKIIIDKENSSEGVESVVKALRPNWSKDKTCAQVNYFQYK